MEISESFADSEHSSKRRRTKREEFLEKVDKLIPWALLVDLVNPHWPNGRRGSPLPRRKQFFWDAVSSCSSTRPIAPPRTSCTIH